MEYFVSDCDRKKEGDCESDRVGTRPFAYIEFNDLESATRMRLCVLCFEEIREKRIAEKQVRG